MANVTNTSHDSDAEKVPAVKEDDIKIELDDEPDDSGADNVSLPCLSPEEYKQKHKIGARISSESTPCSPIKSPQSVSSMKDPFSSPESGSSSCEDTSPVTSPTEEKESVFRIKALDDSGIDVDISGIHKKQPIVHLGERITVSPNGTVYSSSKTDKSKKVRVRSKKTKTSHTERSYVPCRRKREASLNAAARMNILYEPAQKVPRKSSSSSVGNPAVCKGKKSPQKKENFCKKKEKSTSSESDKKDKISDKKSPGKKISKVSEKVRKIAKASKKEKGFSNTKGAAAKSKASTKSALAKYKYYPAKMTKVKKKVKLLKVKNKKKRSSEKDTKKSKTKKGKTDTLRAARTHFTAERKMKYSSDGVKCVGCYRQALCTPSGAICWSNGDGTREGECLPEDKSCQSSSSPYVTPQRMQLMDTGGGYVNTVVPHQTIPACPQCAQRGGIITTAPCQSYVGIGNISSVPMMSYPQAFGGSYPAMSYQANHSTLPHCGLPGCPSCFGATPGIYYPQTATQISHTQPMTHEPCHLSTQNTVAHSLTDKEETKSESDVIDVGETEILDIKPIILKPSKSSLKKSSESSTNIVYKNSSALPSSKDKKGGKKITICTKKTERKTSVSATKSSKSKTKEPKEKVTKKPKYNKSKSLHGWEFEGEPERKKITSLLLGTTFETNCYQSIRHIDGDDIRVRECVMLRSGPKKTDIPYVAKVTNFWESPNDGEMMMSLLWYYQPEHTEGGRKQHHAPCELFASKHRDENSVACIDDKGYVLTFAEYCRYRAELRRQETLIPPPTSVVPGSDYPRRSQLPESGVDPNQVYLCRQVYDFKLKRILKNPS